MMNGRTAIDFSPSGCPILAPVGSGVLKQFSFQIEGMGPLSYESQRGMYLHPTYAVSTAREPLGIMDAWMWARKPKDENGNRNDIKESIRWIEGYERLCEVAEQFHDT